MSTTEKIIGTLVPLSALFSIKNSISANGTLADGLVFLDWLKKTKQSAWQLLPVYQTQLEEGSSSKHIPSPYKSYGIGLDPKYLPASFTNLVPTATEENDFLANNSEWIHDYALFCSLRDYFKTDNWILWDQDIRQRDTAAITYWSEKLTKEITNHIHTQWQLRQAYDELKKKAKSLGILLIGDLPFYVSYRSPLVWAHQNVFDMQKDGTMRFVSGVPNDPPSFFGRQVWGHPLYAWESKKNWENITSFWKLRIRYFARHFDVIRFDHVRGFYQYGAVDENNMQNDHFMNGPGSKAFEKLVLFSRGCGLSTFVEDSGNRIDAMKKDLETLQCPGITILRFAYNEQKNEFVHKYAEVKKYRYLNVAYTTTHDTETLLSYVTHLSDGQKRKFAAVVKVKYETDNILFTKRLRDAIITSPSHMVIIPMQDWLLTTDRINYPGTERSVNDPNWQYRMQTPIEKLPSNFDEIQSLYSNSLHT